MKLGDAAKVTRPRALGQESVPRRRRRGAPRLTRSGPFSDTTIGLWTPPGHLRCPKHGWRRKPRAAASRFAVSGGGPDRRGCWLRACAGAVAARQTLPARRSVRRDDGGGQGHPVTFPHGGPKAAGAVEDGVGPVAHRRAASASTFFALKRRITRCVACRSARTSRYMTESAGFRRGCDVDRDVVGKIVGPRPERHRRDRLKTAVSSRGAAAVARRADARTSATNAARAASSSWSPVWWRGKAAPSW